MKRSGIFIGLFLMLAYGNEVSYSQNYNSCEDECMNSVMFQGELNPCMGCWGDGKVCGHAEGRQYNMDELCCQGVCGGSSTVDCLTHDATVTPAECYPTCGDIPDPDLCYMGDCPHGSYCTSGAGCGCIPICGDGIVGPGEQCDDGGIELYGSGNQCTREQLYGDSCIAVSGDGCSQTCKIEFCGDGIVQPGLGEECDNGGLCESTGESCEEESSRDPGCGYEDCRAQSGDGCSSECLNEQCSNEYNCDDNNECTRDSCVYGGCEHEPIEGCCNADRDCTEGDVCSIATCNGNVCNYDPDPSCCTSDEQCDDDNSCTVNTCVNNECTTEPLCDDGKECTRDSCSNGECYFRSTCDDGRACTTDACTDNGCYFDDSRCCQNDLDCQGGGFCNHCTGPCTRSECFCNNGSCDSRSLEDSSCTGGECNPWPEACGGKQPFGLDCGGQPEDSCQWCVLDFWGPNGEGNWKCDAYPNAEILWPDSCGEGGNNPPPPLPPPAPPTSSDGSASFSFSASFSDSQSYSYPASFSDSYSASFSFSYSASFSDSHSASFSDSTSTSFSDSTSSASSQSSISSSNSSTGDDSNDDMEDSMDDGLDSSRSEVFSENSSSSSSYDQCDFCPACTSCRRCGIGIANICDEEECNSLGLCSFTNQLLGGTCSADPEICTVCN